MRLIFIYGPPAVGKLTVARELGRLTGLPVFDNHLSFDCVAAVFGYESPTLGPLTERIRHLVIGEAARQGISLIFTFVYRHDHDVPYVERIVDLVEREGGKVDFVQLRCSVEAQEERVARADRAGRKIDSAEWLREFMRERDLRTPIPGRGGLRIDNTALSPEKSAERIAQRLSLMPS